MRTLEGKVIEQPMFAVVNGLRVHERWFIRLHAWYWQEVHADAERWEGYRRADAARKAAARVKETYAA